MSDGTTTITSDVDISTQEPVRTPQGPVAIVLAGAGARGAYEAGYIATLLPHLQPRPTIFVGTSAGAINAALLASVAHLPPTAAANKLMESWRKLRAEHVFRPLWKSVPRAALAYAKALLTGGEAPLSLADTAPLRAALNDEPELLDWAQIRENLRNPAIALDVLAFAATETGSGRSKVFFEAKRGWEPTKGSVFSRRGSIVPDEYTDETQAIDYIALPLNGDHIRASAAIPVLFPPVRIDYHARHGYFIDGGVRLNAPLKPAFQFGAAGIVVVATDPRHYGTSLVVEPKPPTMQGQILQVLRGLFADRMIEDIRVALNRNRKAGKHNDNRVVPIIFGGPLDQDRVGGVAARATDELLRGLPLLRYFKNIDLSLLSWLTSVSATSGPDLISYVLFQPLFLENALKAGIQDASALLNDYPTPEDLWSALVSRDARRCRQGAEAPVTPQPAA